VDNKKMTHDIFVECGLEHLRPVQKAFPRRWSADLPANITRELMANKKDAIVLKLVNRCRGAGVVVARVGRELDQVLRRLLVPSVDASDGGVPQTESFEEALNAGLGANPCDLKEQALHWWSNECPVFIAEKCMASQSVEKDGANYDATMRIGFVLLRSQDSADSKFRVEFLGAYWKLPSEPMTSQDIRARCISKARSGTAVVDNNDLHDCYDELRPALASVFASDKAGASSIITRYNKNPSLFAFTLARQAAEHVKRQGRSKVREVSAEGESSPGCSSFADDIETLPMRCLTLAHKRLQARLPQEWERVSQRDTNEAERVFVKLRCTSLFSLSYVERQMGYMYANRDDWENAETHFRRSLLAHPLNATSEYLIGVCHLKRAENNEAMFRFVRSLRLDPEFKAAYVNIGVVALTLKDWSVAILVSEAGLKRHPQAFQCNFNMGLALAHQLHQALCLQEELERLQGLACRSVDELRAAKEQKERIKSDWGRFDEALLILLEAMNKDFGAFRRMSDIPPQRRIRLAANLHKALCVLEGWSQINFRP